MTLKQLEKEYTTRKLHQTYLRGGLNGLIDLLDVVEKLEEDCIEKWTREDVQLCWDIQEDIFICLAKHAAQMSFWTPYRNNDFALEPRTAHISGTSKDFEYKTMLIFPSKGMAEEMRPDATFVEIGGGDLYDMSEKLHQDYRNGKDNDIYLVFFSQTGRSIQFRLDDYSGYVG